MSIGENTNIYEEILKTLIDEVDSDAKISAEHKKGDDRITVSIKGNYFFVRKSIDTLIAHS